MGKKQKTKNWLSDHKKDIFVRRAQKDGYRSRACYKLIEVLDKHEICLQRSNVLELGAAPGGWTQVMLQRFPKITMVCVDLLPMDPVDHAIILSGDFRSDSVQVELKDHAPFDLLLSDMSPNKTGVSVVDQYQALELWEMSLEMAKDYLNHGGHMLIKVFHGKGFDDFLADFRQCFSKVLSVKPEASRSHSNELYLLGKGFTLDRCGLEIAEK